MPGRTTRNRSSSTPAPAPAPAPEPVPQLLQQAFDAYVPLPGYGDQLCPAVFATARGIRDADSAAAGADINVGFRQQSGGFRSVQEYTKGDLRIILSNGGCLFGKFSARVLFTTLMANSTQAQDAHPTAAAVVAGISAALLEATASFMHLPKHKKNQPNGQNECVAQNRTPWTGFPHEYRRLHVWHGACSVAVSHKTPCL